MDTVRLLGEAHQVDNEGLKTCCKVLRTNGDIWKKFGITFPDLVCKGVGYRSGNHLLK